MLFVIDLLFFWEAHLAINHPHLSWFVFSFSFFLSSFAGLRAR